MQLGTLFIIILIFVLFIYFAWYNSANQKGKRGEIHVFSILSQLPEEYTILNDLVFQIENGTTQIDHVPEIGVNAGTASIIHSPGFRRCS